MFYYTKTKNYNDVRFSLNIIQMFTRQHLCLMNLNTRSFIDVNNCIYVALYQN